MDIIQGIIIGIVQGLTEFLPVSSSAHLVFIQNILGVESSLAFDTFLHLGTLIAVLWFFRYDCVLQEMDTAAVVVRAIEQQDMTGDEKAEYVISQMQGRYKDHYISWSFGEIHTSCTADSVECSLSGQASGMPGGVVFGELSDTWSSSVTRSRRSVSEVFVIRTYRKALGLGKEIE